MDIFQLIYLGSVLFNLGTWTGCFILNKKLGEPMSSKPLTWWFIFTLIPIINTIIEGILILIVFTSILKSLVREEKGKMK